MMRPGGRDSLVSRHPYGVCGRTLGKQIPDHGDTGRDHRKANNPGPLAVFSAAAAKSEAEMGLHFESDEFQQRQAAACKAMRVSGLDALLLFRQESMYYLTGYDTFGYVHFQTLVLSESGELTLLTRAPDRLQARYTSNVEDLRIWADHADADPCGFVRDILLEKGLRGARVGVEYEAYGLTAAKGLALNKALDGFCSLDDASNLVSRLRLIKSEAELACVRRAGELADEALAAALSLARPGAFEGDILSAMHARVFEGGGDDPANEYIIGSGPGALMCRYYTGRRHLDIQDQLTLEFAGVYRHYHACHMRTLLIGEANAAQKGRYGAARDSLTAAREALRPDQPIGRVFDAHARVLDEAGYREQRMNACGYSLGATYAPSWMDWPMFYRGNPVLAEPGMVFFIHIILFDEPRGEAMTLGQTLEVTQSGNEPISKASLDLIVNG